MEEPGPTVLAVCGLAFEAAIARGAGVVAIHGPGAAAIQRLDRVLADAHLCRGIISFGIAGGLDPGLPPGACVLADAIVDGEERLPVDERWLLLLKASLPGAMVGALAGVSCPVTDARAKAGLRQRSGAFAVDMESHLAALAARRHGLPFAALRIVADPAHRGIPDCALAALCGDGGMALAPLLRALASNPAELRMLATLAADAIRAHRCLRSARATAGHAFGAP
jgi:hopanoid-associated phosphorylase